MADLHSELLTQFFQLLNQSTTSNVMQGNHFCLLHKSSDRAAAERSHPAILLTRCKEEHHPESHGTTHPQSTAHTCSSKVGRFALKITWDTDSQRKKTFSYRSFRSYNLQHSYYFSLPYYGHLCFELLERHSQNMNPIA